MARSRPSRHLLVLAGTTFWKSTTSTGRACFVLSPIGVARNFEWSNRPPPSPLHAKSFFGGTSLAFSKLSSPTSFLEASTPIPYDIDRALSGTVESWESDDAAPDDDATAGAAGDEEDEFGNSDSAMEYEDALEDNNSLSSETPDPLMEEFQQWQIAVDKSISALEKKQASLEREQEKQKNIEQLQHRAELLKSHWHAFSDGGGVTSALVLNWETGVEEVLSLDPAYDHCVAAEVEGLYAQVKRLKRGAQAVGSLLEKTEAALNGMREVRTDLVASAESSLALSSDGKLFQLLKDRLIRNARATNFTPPSETKERNTKQRFDTKKATPGKSSLGPPKLGTPASNVRKLQSSAGCTILVGRNRRGNEHLSLSVARDKDIWMHARGSPGAHVLVLQRRGSETPLATDDCLQLAADLAAFYSDARSERSVDVIAAEPKHVLKPRGAPLGAVKIREELRVFSGRPNNVPVEFKEARAVSGLSDEYRIKDKSQLRKQNKQQAVKQKVVAKQKAKAKVQKSKRDELDSFY